MKRSELPDSVFGIPEERKYPMPDKRHTLSAIKLFGHVEPKYEEELAKNIIKNMKKYNIPESAVGKDNKLRKYIDKYYNEVSLLEGYIFNEKDIYYNKDKFDSGEINLCFITGHSGSGKSTMGRNMEKDKVEHYELDDLQCIKDHFTMEQLKEYGDLIYSYFSGPGKKFYLTYKELVDNKISGSEYEDILFKDFVYYAMKYAKAHKDKKIVVEGVWLFCNSENGKPWFSPEEFKDYAFYIKGISMVISKHRAAKRDAKEDTDNKKDEIKSYLNNFIRKNWKWYFTDEKAINRFRKYFSNLIKKDQMNESYFTSDPNRKIPVDVLEEAGKKCIQLSSECAYITPVQPNKIWVNEEDNTFTFATYNGDMKYLSEIVDYFNKNNLFKYGRFRVYAKDVYDEDISISNHMNTKWWLRGEVIEYNNTIKEEARLEENKIPCLYHLSTENHDGDVFEPRYYDNDNVKAGIERRVKRICFSDNINGCIYSIFPNGAYDIDLYVHIPASEVSKVYKTTSDDIYDSEITHELWVKEPVTMKCIGKIHISGVDKNKEKILNSDKDKTGYGKRKYYEPRWNWVEKMNESSNLKEFSVGAGPVIGIGSNPEPIYIVNYMQNNVFSGATQERFGICKTGMADLHIFGGKYNRLHCTDLDNFEKEASNIKMYRYTGQLSDKYHSIYSIIEDSDTDLDFYRLLTGEDISNRSDIKNNPNFVKESYVRDELSAISECVVSGVKEVDKKYEIPLLGLNEDGRTYNYYRDLDGVYIKNEVTNIRSASYNSVEDILEDVSNLVKKGVLY